MKHQRNAWSWTLITGLAIPYGVILGVGILAAPMWTDLALSPVLVSGAVIVALLGAIAFGGILLLTLGLTRRRPVESVEAKLVGFGPCHHTRQVMLRGDERDVFDQMEKIVEKVGVRDVLERDREAGVLLVRTRWSIKSPGELVNVTVFGRRGEVDVRIHSRPCARNTLLDYGKGRANVDFLARQLLTIFPARLEGLDRQGSPDTVPLSQNELLRMYARSA